MGNSIQYVLRLANMPLPFGWLSPSKGDKDIAKENEHMFQINQGWGSIQLLY